MKNKDIITLANCGVLSITAHDIPAAHAYKVLKFKKAVKAAMQAFQDSERAIFSDCGVTDTDGFNRRLNELRNKELTKEEKAELSGMEKTISEIHGLQGELKNEDVAIDVKAMPYDVWHDLQNENKAVNIFGKTVDVLSGDVEEILEGILWVDPEEE